MNWISKDRLQNYMELAEVVSKNSPDQQTKVGSILINPNTKAVLACSYNGFVRGAPDHKLPTTRPDKYAYIIHAEQNMILNCARHGICTEGCVVVCTLSPCIQCLRFMYQAGVVGVYFKDMYKDFNKSLNMGDLPLKLDTYGSYYYVAL